MLFYANSLIVIEFCHDSIKIINFLYFRGSSSVWSNILSIFQKKFMNMYQDPS